jgi:multidrug efflux pump subunit AcrB
LAGLFRFVVGHRTAANLLALALLGFGLWGALNIRAQFMPDVVSESIQLDIAWPGAGPGAVDAQIAAPVDAALLALPGLSRLKTVAQEGLARFTLVFEPGVDLAAAHDEARAAIDALTSLPETAEEPELRRRSWRDRVTNIGVWGPLSPEQIARIAQQLQAELFAAGVTRVQLDGAPDPVLRVAAREIDLARRDVTLRELSDSAAAVLSATPAGDIAEGRTRVVTGLSQRSVEAVAAAPLLDGSGARLTVGDIADVRLEGAAQGELYLANDEPMAVLRVDRDAAGDALAIQAAVEETIARLAQTLPQDVRMATFAGHADAIAGRLSLLIDNALLGLVLVLGLLFLFLSARTALWVAAGIPVAMAGALGMMHLLGLTLDMISMFALIICIGIVVDDAIVVGEHADHLARRNLSPAAAAQAAAARMLAPVIAASLTTVIAFLSLLAIGGRFGAFIVAIPLTVSLVLIASLIESFLILPAHMRHALAAKRSEPWYDAPSRAVDRGFTILRDRAFRPLATAAVRWRYVVLAGAVGLLLHSLALLVSGEARWRFFDGPERGSGAINVVMLPGATRADTAAMVAEIERALLATADSFAARHDVNALRFHHGVVGGEVGGGLAAGEGADPDRLGGVWMELVDADARPFPLSVFMAAWRDAVVSAPLVETMAGRWERGGPGDEAIAVEVTARDAEALRAAADALADALRDTPGVMGVDSTVTVGKEEATLTLTPFGRARGFDEGELGATLRSRISGIEAATFPLEGRSATLIVGVDEASLKTDYLSRALVRAPDGAWVRLGDVARVSYGVGVDRVTRVNGLPTATVSAALDDADPGRAAAAAAHVEKTVLPALMSAHDVQAKMGGLRAQERAFLDDATIGLLLCAAGIYAVLAWVLGSWSMPLVVLLVAPLGLIGALWGHVWMDVTLSMFSVVGLLGMTGIIVNDAIVLVMAAEEKARSRALTPALIDAACDRLRAVFLTTATTVAGLAPMLYETSRQAQFLKPTVVTLAFGLAFGMVLVLLATPAMVAVRGDVLAALRSARRMARRAGRWTARAKRARG